jgi:hypothetical protein
MVAMLSGKRWPKLQPVAPSEFPSVQRVATSGNVATQVAAAQKPKPN